MDRGSEEKVIAKAIAKLGEEGWEMIIDRTHEGTPLKIYFKRPKQENKKRIRNTRKRSGLDLFRVFRLFRILSLFHIL